MAQDKQGLLERFSERYPVQSASVVALCFALVCLIGAYIALDETEILSLKFPHLSNIFPSKVNEWGDFLAGIFAPAALFFLALSVRIQSRELRAAVEAQEAMKSEMEAQVSQMKFAGMAPFFHDKAREVYEKFGENERSSVFDLKRYIMNYDHDSSLIDGKIFSLSKIVNDMLLDDSISSNYGYSDSIHKMITDLKNELNDLRKPIMHIMNNMLSFGTYFNFYAALDKLYGDADGSGAIYKAFSNTLYAEFGEACRFLLSQTTIIIKISFENHERLEKFNSICGKFYEKY